MAVQTILHYHVVGKLSTCSLRDSSTGFNWKEAIGGKLGPAANSFVVTGEYP